MYQRAAWALVGMGMLVVGCASPIQAPKGFLAQAIVIVQAPGEPTLVIGKPSDGGSAARIDGGDKGALVGGGLGALACLGTGPFMAACIVTIPVLSAGAGAITGNVVGAIQAEGAEHVDAKQQLLQKAVTASAQGKSLAEHLRDRTRERLAVSWPVEGEAGARSLPTAWVLQVRPTLFATQGSREGQPFLLVFQASLEFIRVGDTQPTASKIYRAVSPTAKTTDQWSSEDAAEVRRALEHAFASLADQMTGDLADAAK